MRCGAGMSNMERIIEITPAFNKMSEGLGVHGCGLRMVLKGPLGAVNFVLYTQWQLPSTIEMWKGKGQYSVGMNEPVPADLGFHSPKPIYDGQPAVRSDCSYVDGPCYYDGSSLNAMSMYRVLVERGSDGVWEELERYYRHTFEGAEWNLPYPDEWKRA